MNSESYYIPERVLNRTEREEAYELLSRQPPSIERNHRHNAICPLFQLPREILVEIARHTWKSEYSVDDNFPCDASWVRVTHVCHYLREVFVGCPSLWPDVNCAQPQWGQINLERSQTAAIRVSERYTKPGNLELLESSLHQLHRIKGIRFKHIPAYLSSLLKQSAPRMEICCLSFKSLDAVSQTDSEGMLFDGKAPRLTALFLTGCGLDWHFNNYVNLQYLDIHKTPVMFSAKTVIEDLSNTPHLKKLTLRQCFYPYGETFSSTAHLPKLEELTIESELASCVQLMEHLTYPKHLLLAIICTESTNEIVGAAQHGLMDSLAQTLGEKWKAKEHPILRIEIHPDFSGFVFRGRTDIEDLKRSPLHLNIVAKFEHDTQYFLGAILRHLNPLEGLKFLEISNMRIADKDWVDLDASAGQLEAICIDKANVPGFLRGFSQGCKGVEQLPETLGQIQATPLPLFQTLDALKLSRVHFAEETGDGTSTVFDNLHRCLISRKAMGCELPELSIHSCYYVTETQIQQLSSAVGRVRGAYYDHDHHRWHFL